MRIYLAARFSRRHELTCYRDELAEHGIDVAARWLDGGHEWTGVPDEDIPADELARFALDDIEDINLARVIVCFTENPRTAPARGGRHVEAGYAIARGKLVFCVGPIENVFYALPQIQRFPDWETAKTQLIKIAPFLDARRAELQAARIP